MSREPTVIALVPHFRCEGWLDHCLSSLVGQSRPLDGIVVIDDASPEPPVEIVRRFPGVTLLRSPRNVGPYRLVQQVIDDTAADWYMFQDADDWSAADRLERLLAGAAASGAELIGSDYVMLATDEGLTIPHAFPLDANAALAAAPTCHALQHPTSMVRRDLVERLGGYASGLRFSGDDEFLRRAAYVTRIANIPRFLYFRRHRPDSLTTAAGTGHGSPARRQLLEALAARAVANATAVERGETPVLDPYAQAPPVILEHLCGPPPEGSSRRFVAPRAAARRARQRFRREGPRPAAPTLVVGGPASGADTLFWSLGQHPSLFALLDVSWLAPIAEAVDRAAEPTGMGHLSLSTDRRLAALDGLGATPDDLRRALGSSVAQVVADGAGDASGWVALAPANPELVQAFLLLFPDARVIHVVRDADQVAAALARKSKAVPQPLPPGDASRKWLDGVQAGLECERVAGGDRMLRVRFGELVLRPADVLTRCLEFVGACPHPRCAQMLEGLDVAGRPLAQWEHHPAPADARDLSTALCGPPPVGSPWVAGRSLRATPPAARPPRPASPTPARRAAGATPKDVTQPAPPPAPPPLPKHVMGPAALLRSTLARGTVVAVVTKGESRFLELGDVHVWHFPQTADGQWAGHHPADTQEIVRHLEELWDRGARYFLIPPYASWWLDHYAGLRAHLLGAGSLVAEGPDTGWLFALGPGRPKAARKATPSNPKSRRRSVSVISWNTTHNPLGRAHVLADLLRGRYEVELVGARFDHFGTETWRPLQEMEIPLRSFPGGSFPELFGQLEKFAGTITSDVVVVSKPRLPSYLLGMLTKAFDGRPLVLDVDDRELTFVGSNRPRPLEDLRSRRDDELANPYGRWWTELCESLIGAADHVTVSNETLRNLFGGTVVPHARDERLFDPSRVDREAARARFGFAPDERIVLFGGTPRRHKGVIELARALGEVGDPRARLCLLDSPELDELRTELAPHSGRLRVVPAQPFSELPELLAAADLVAVLQDPASEVSRYQMPAKITDALAMQVPCLVRRVPPLEPLLSAGHLHEVGTEGLAAALSSTLDDMNGARERARASREIFLADYSFAAVRPRFEAVVESAVERPRPLPPELAEAVAFARERFGQKPPAVSVARPSRQRPPRRGRPAAGGFDVVMFWKQHDSGLYGRRHDMLMQHLARSPRVGQVVQFDAPVDLGALRWRDADVPTHNALLEQLAMARVDGVEAMPGLHQYSFVYGGDRRGDGEFPTREEYAVHVKQALARHRVGERPVVFWVYPKNFDFPDIARAFGPDLIVADVVDDHRTWLRAGGGGEERVLRNYEEIAGSADVVLVNCEPMRELMRGMGAPAHLVANAAEYPDPLTSAPLEVPEELQRLEGPILGYVGNLSSRIDVELLEHLVTRRPEWNLVLIGSAHAGRSIAPLARHPNVALLGPRPYEVAKRYIRAFDVALIPHLDDAMTRAMNPLKAFVYCALEVPVVSTDIANLGELRPLVSVASGHDDFITKVDAAIRAGRAPLGSVADAVLRRNSWESRTQVITDLLDEALARKTEDR